jgi:putative nucleotidyltransferase with HDIG domain
MPTFYSKEIDTMLKLPLKVRLYTLLIICIGATIFISGIQMIIASNMIYPVLFFCMLCIVSESLAIPVENSSYISVSFAIGLMSILVYHPLISAVIMSMGILFYIEYKNGKYNHIFNTSIYKRMFTSGTYCISATLAGYGYLLGKNLVSYITLSSFNILGIVFATLTFIVTNIITCTILFSLIENKSFIEMLYKNTWIIKNFFAIAPLGILMAIAYTNYGWFAVLLFFGPLLLARYSFKLYLDMRNIYFETIKALSNAIDAKDHYTNGHSHRVAHYSEVIARKMGLTGKSIDIIKTAAILHDIGKIGIEDHILNKPSHLTDNEFYLIKQHPSIGAKILEDVDFLGEVSRIIKSHHERYDGKGYPNGLKEGEIPIEASILAVADAFDAMTSNRPYRKAMTFNAAINIIDGESGKQFNPIVVKTFKDIMKENREMLINVS